MVVYKSVHELFDMLEKTETGFLFGDDHEMVKDYTPENPERV